MHVFFSAIVFKTKQFPCKAFATHSTVLCCSLYELIFLTAATISSSLRLREAVLTDTIICGQLVANGSYRVEHSRLILLA